MIFSPDSVENRLSTIDQARDLIDAKLPKFKDLYSIWSNWFQQYSSDKGLAKVATDVLQISYARMALRNGSISPQPRQYHNEKHIEDLLYRMMAVSEFPESKSIPDYGWSLLTIFIGCHDLRQAEAPESKTLIGNNETASYKELVRILSKADPKRSLSEKQLQLLKLMIYGSTFGTNKDENGNVFNGNLVAYLLEQTAQYSDVDKEIAFLACDIDTANVSAPLAEYANSSVNVYQEIQEFGKTPLPAKIFFSDMQEDYFFTLQSYNSKLGYLALNDLKLQNAPFIRQVSKIISDLEESLSDEQVIAFYLEQIQSRI